MPFPNEHACRLRQPGGFQEGQFRRVKRGRLELIVGRLKGESTTTLQSMRFPKDDWTPEEARRICQREGGSFEPAGDGPTGDEPNPRLDAEHGPDRFMAACTRALQGKVPNPEEVCRGLWGHMAPAIQQPAGDDHGERPPKEWFDRCVEKAGSWARDPEALCNTLWHRPEDFSGGPALRRAWGLDGPTQNQMEPPLTRDHQDAHFQADAIRITSDGQWAIIPTILTKEGVQNRALKTADEIKKAHRHRGFENLPITDGHPDQSRFVTSQRQVRGHFRNSDVLDPGAAVKGETWLFIGNDQGKRLLEEIKAGRKTGISLGFWHNTIKKSGVFDGKTYDHIQTDILPNHAAILPLGACDRTQGCGLLLA